MLTRKLIEREAARVHSRVVELRRAIHREPELGLATPKTQALILRELARIGIDRVSSGSACTSVWVDIEGAAVPVEGPRRVALRADMDALPLTEHAEVDWASCDAGKMHACGHDGHVAMLLGAAEILHAHRDSFAGTVRLLFQPGEEGYGGAKIMIREGALDGVDAAFALHLEPSRKPDLVALRRGTMLAAFDNFLVTFKGRGGHASTPFVTQDPIPAIGPFVDGLSHVAARETDPDDRVVLSVTRVTAGTTDNVIPPTAECLGTIRSLTPAGRARAREKLRRVAEGVAASRGLEVDIELREGYPPTMNAPEVVDHVMRAAGRLDLAVEDMRSPFMGAEDFSYVLERIPGAMAFLGCKVVDGGPLHSDLMKIDESVLETGTAVHVAVALELLGAGDALV
jgi:hippurate hydrolase